MTARRTGMTLFALLLANFVINIDTTIVNVALPTLARELHTTNSELQWIVDAYNLVFAALLLAAGSVSDRVGRKGVLLVGLAVFGLASIAGALVHTATELIAARAVMGAGAAMVFPATLSIIANVYPGRSERAKVIGLWGAVAGIAIALGPIIGGALLEHFTWPCVFYAMAPFAAVNGLLVARFVPRSRDPMAPRSDFVGFVLATFGIAVLVFTLIEAPTFGWTSTRAIVGFALALIALAAFVLWERRMTAPMLDVRLFFNPRFSAACAAVTVSYFTLFGFIFLVTQYFQFFRHYGPLSTGVHMLPVAFSIAIGSVVGTKLAVRIGTKLIVTVGMVAVAVFYAWASGDVPATPYLTIFAQMTIFGIGMGFTAAPATEAILGVVPVEKAGVGSAVNDTTRLLGGTLGVAVIGSIFASLYSKEMLAKLPATLPHGAVDAAAGSVGGALAVAQDLTNHGWTELAPVVRHAATAAFNQGMSTGCLVAAGAAALGAITAAALLPSFPERRDTEAAAPSPVAAPEPLRTRVPTS
jgi:EmrB/QacA subfamily drug resistance transporter